MIHRKPVRAFEALEPRQLLAADTVIINEIMYHQPGDDTGLEFIELLNATESSQNLSGWKFDTGVSFDFPEISIPGGGFLVVAADESAFRERYPDVSLVVGGWSGRLANRGEAITLVDDLGNEVNRVRYADEGEWAERYLAPADQGFRGWRWLAEHDGDGKSLELKNPELSNQSGQNWDASVPMGGTPGRINSVFADDIAPLAIDLNHVPVLPSSTDAVSIRVRVVDELSTGITATLFYRDEQTNGFESKSMQMMDDHFTATVPPFPHGTIVEYFVTARDSTGLVRTVPGYQSDDPDRTANRLYQVSDDVPETLTWKPGDQPMTLLVMRQHEQNILADIGDGPLAESESNAQMNAGYIRIDGNGVDLRTDVGIRNRGGASRIGPPNNYRVNFPHDRLFDGATSYDINAQFGYVETIGNAIYRMAGLPAPENTPIQVRVNGADLSDPMGEMFGSYVETETVSGSFPDRFFPEDNRGNLYRVVEENLAFGALGYAGNDPSNYQENFSKRTNEEDNDWTDIIDLLNVLNNATDASFVTEVERVLDVDQWMRYLALDSLLGNSETGLNAGRADKFWMYRGTKDTRFQLIPHDLDTILDVGRRGEPNRSVFSNYVEVDGLRRLLTHPAFVPRYYQAFVDLMENVFNPETLHPLIDRLADHVPEFALDRMKQFVVERIAGVQAQLPLKFVVSTSLPIVDGYPRTTLPQAEILGIANSLTTQSIMVNRQAANWSPATRQWSVPVTGDGDTRSLVSEGADWRYYDQGSIPSTSWRSNSFNDGAWLQGPAPLGYGEGDEATTLRFGSSPFNKHITSYFRHQFQVDDISQVLDLTMRLVRDDGAVVYLNGEEVVRDNMPNGVVDSQTVASSWIGGNAEAQRLSFAIDPSHLVNGVNTIAVEVHQVDSVDDDLRFDLALEATVGALSGGVPLNPGINRVLVKAFDQPEGAGNVVDQGFLDIWYDGSRIQNPPTCDSITVHGEPAMVRLSSVMLSQDTVFAPCGPAYRITGQVRVPEGVTVTILPGTTIFFGENAGFLFEGGRLLAEGTDVEPIRLTRAPNSQTSWGGLQFVDSTVENRISHAILEYASTAEGMVGLRGSRIEIDDVTFDHADFFRIKTVGSSLIVRNSTFTDLFAADEAPLTDNSSEHIKGSGILTGGQFLLEGNYFGKTKGHNDAIDFDGAELPGPIPLIQGNFFAGSGDDALDLEADALIVDNTFVQVRKDRFNTSTGEANAISAGAGKDYFVFRNTFHDVDHAVQVKDDAFLHFEHNTVDKVAISPIYFDLPDRTPGRGADVRDSIFSNTSVTFGAADQAQSLVVSGSIVTDDALSLGPRNFKSSVEFVENGDFELAPGSPGSGLAFAGNDLGADVRGGVWIAGVPASVTRQQTARLTVGGPGIREYQYRLDQGAWSDRRSVDETIVLPSLAPGLRSVEIRGFGTTDLLSPDSVVATWEIDPDQPALMINEVLASNDGISFRDRNADLVELYNDANVEVDLAGLSIGDDADRDEAYLFPPGTTIDPGGFLVLEASDDELGFRLNAEGEGVFLFDTAENGYELLDHVKFGIQVTDLSIGRVGPERTWTLTQPSFGFENVAVEKAMPDGLRINEWLAAGDLRFDRDFVELYNQASSPVALGGLFLTDEPLASPTKHGFAPLSFIGGGGFVTLELNGDPDENANEVAFGLSENGEHLALLNEQLQMLDQVLVFDQINDVSQGRVPDGGPQISFSSLATPGNPNLVFDTKVNSLIRFEDNWRYDQRGEDLGTNWRDTAFDDSSWESGPGPLGLLSGPLDVPLQTFLDPPSEREVVTHYFRSEFQVDEALLEGNRIEFELQMMIDDGAVVYINGVEVLRDGLPDGVVTASTTANQGIGIPVVTGPFRLPVHVFRPGLNQIAVETHQVSRRNADIVMGLELVATETSASDLYENAMAIRDGLRISEVMYHPAGDDDAEFIELVNVSTRPLELDGVTVEGRIDVVLSGGLEPGEHAVVVASVNEFRSRYGTDPRILATYSGHLSNGQGELEVLLHAPLDSRFDTTVLRLAYDDAWYPETDGNGKSLQIADENGGLANWIVDTGWLPSFEEGGTPGRPFYLAGDFDRNQRVNSLDIDLLNAAIATASNSEEFDLNRDGELDATDVDWLVEEILRTKNGDIDLNGQIDFADFLTLSANFGNTDAVWAEGDVDADGEVGFADFLLMANNFGFQRDLLQR